MPANIETVTLANSGGIYSLRGDMGLNFNLASEPDDTFNITVRTYGSAAFPITTNLGQFRKLDDSVVAQLDLGGAPGLYATLRYNTKTKTFDIVENNLTALTAISGGSAGGSTGGSGSGFTPEVVIRPDADGNVFLSKLQGTAFRLLLDKNAKILNPVGYTSGERIKVVIVQGDTAAYTITWDTMWSFSDALPPGFGSNPKAENVLVTDFTAGTKWHTDVKPDKNVANGYGLVTPIARIGMTQFYALGNAANTGAFNKVVSGETVYILRNGKSAEATGTISNSQGGVFIVAGQPTSNTGGDQRPKLELLQTDFQEGPPRGANRPSFGKAILNFEGAGQDGNIGLGMTATVRDLILTGARNSDGDARGIGQNGQVTLTVKNVDITNCHNGILTDNLTVKPLTIIDSLIDANGMGGPNSNPNQGFSSSGYTHNIYAGHNPQVITITRSTISNALEGHDIKVRSGTLIMNQVLASGAAKGRELDLPNGGIARITNCEFRKNAGASQNNLIAIGNSNEVAPGSPEGIDSSRTREYVFTNCRFVNDVDPARDTSFLSTKDPDVAVQFIDCEFIGAGTLAKNTAGPATGGDQFYVGMQMTKGVYHMPGKPPVWTLTGGPIGPKLTPGKPAVVAMTPVV